MAWATPDDVIDSWIGDDAPDDDLLIAKWIGRAERLIRREFPALADRIASGAEPDLADTVNDVVVSMVSRVFRNPSGHRSVSGQETTGQYSGSNTITYGGDNPGALELLDSERAALSLPGEKRGRRAYSFMPGGIR